MSGFFKNYTEKRENEAKLEILKAKADILRYKAMISERKAANRLKKLSNAGKMAQEVEDLRSELAPKNPWLEVLNSPAVQTVLDLGISKLGGGKTAEKISEIAPKLANLSPKQKMQGMKKLNKFMKTLTAEQKQEGLQLITEFMGEVESDG
jgi:hypothetical protein